MDKKAIIKQLGSACPNPAKVDRQRAYCQPCDASRVKLCNYQQAVIAGRHDYYELWGAMRAVWE